MKSSAAEQRHHEVVVAVAKEYEGKGYDVTVEPLPDHVPGFLRPYQPDILVRKGEENYVIEVALPGAHRGDRHLWTALAEKVSRQPGRHLKVVVADVEAGEAPRLDALPTADDVRAQLKVAESLLEQVAWRPPCCSLGRCSKLRLGCACSAMGVTPQSPQRLRR